MDKPATVHNTFVIERTYPKPPGQVFAAFADTAKKKRWYAAGGAHDVLSYELDFRVGGKEVLVGRMKEGTPIAGAVLTWSQTFVDVAEGQRIVFSQTLDVGDRRISCALITAEMQASGAGCRLVFTHQAVFIEPADGPQMREFGWNALLDALGQSLDSAPDQA
jgi:uncharacterized protein YndB with AHSA1/START domain